MTVTNLGWREALNAIRGARSCVNPNCGFQKQLQQYETQTLEKERARVKKKFIPSIHDDTRECLDLLASYQKSTRYGRPKKKFDGLSRLPSSADEKKLVDCASSSLNTSEGEVKPTSSDTSHHQE